MRKRLTICHRRHLPNRLRQNIEKHGSHLTILRCQAKTIRMTGIVRRRQHRLPPHNHHFARQAPFACPEPQARLNRPVFSNRAPHRYASRHLQHALRTRQGQRQHLSHCHHRNRFVHLSRSARPNRYVRPSRQVSPNVSCARFRDRPSRQITKMKKKRPPETSVPSNLSAHRTVPAECFRTHRMMN